MAADISRIRHNPLLDFSGVELKQGGVLLDADFNELVALLDRRLRAAASDVLGRATVSSSTPDAFKVSVNGATLSIGKGRLYVDGLLAECHGGPADKPAQKILDALLAEPTFPEPLSYASQPFFASPPALPVSGQHLVYLDVWEREVTAVENPDLIEVAVNVDTSSRRQTVWQLRVLAQNAGNAGCATPDANMPGWAETIAPSVAQLSTGTYEPQGSNNDPCELPPSGGYRGLENQTYRVEIHDAGLPGGAATFKWSRDNASVASRVSAVISSTQLELVSLGRDDVLRFNSGDWVEITDDLREQSQRCGEMRRISVVDATRCISFTPDLPLDMRAASPGDSGFAQRRNLRVRRWDQQHQVLQVDSSGHSTVYQDLDASNGGVIKVPPVGTTLVLENGITVNFGVAAGIGQFHAGDHWIFAARTANASVEILGNAPPRGIHHHYARLGIWNLATSQVSDCRHHWPPDAGDCNDCACTECVTPLSHSSGSLTLQAAVDRVQQRGGGTVCLAIGEYTLDKPVQLRNARSLRIRGEGAGTLLVGLNGAFIVSDCLAVGIEDLSIISTGRWHAIQLQSSIGITLQRLAVVLLNTVSSSAAIGLSGVVLTATIRENLIIAQNGVVSGDIKTDVIATGVNKVPAGFLLSALLRIEDNTFVCAQHAVDFSGLVVHLLRHDICRNDVVGCKQAAINLLGLGGSGSSMRLCDNNISGSSHGIAAGVDGLWIEGNKLTATRASGNPLPTGGGIVLTPGIDKSGPKQCQILANQIRGYERGAVVVAAPTGELIIKLNLISHCGLGIVVEDTGNSVNVSIDNNHLSDIGSGDPARGTVAISVARADAAAVSGNTISRVGLSAAQAPLVAGILAVAVDRLRVAGNSLADIGPSGNFDRSHCLGVMVRAPFASAAIVHNQIDRESKPLAQGGGRFAALWVDELSGLGNGDSAANADAAGNVSGQVAALAAGATLIFGMQRAYLKTGYANAAIGTEAAVGASVSVLGNHISSRGTLPAVRIQLRGDCLFNDNLCVCQVGSADAVLLLCDTSIVNANRVRGGEISIHIPGKATKATVLGNITTGSISLDGPLGAPWLDLNLRG